MKAADQIITAAQAAGITHCFANPGTTEMPLVEAFDKVSGIKPILCTFEGVATGAADGYARMKGIPGLTLLHLGPGFANGIANLHNARRADSPIINLIGEHTTDHLPFDPPLAMPLAKLAAAVPGHVETVPSCKGALSAFAACYREATKGKIASLIFPHDLQMAECGNEKPLMLAQNPLCVSDDAVEEVASRVKRGGRLAMILGGKALSRKGLMMAGRLARDFGIALFHETFTSRMEKGAGLPAVTRIPYFPESGKESLAPFDRVILTGAPAPVAFFGYPHIKGRLLEEDREMVLARPGEDVVEALEHLADILGSDAPLGTSDLTPFDPPALPSGDLNIETLGAVLSALQPDGAIIIDEGITSGFHYTPMATTAAPHTVLTLTGGAIGSGIPMSLGAAMACPDRPVIDLQADGSALFTMQGLWTQAREKANVTTIVCSNRSYDILKVEVDRAGNKTPGPQTLALTDLGNPEIGWVGLSQSLGVPALRVETAEAFAAVLKTALAENGPFLIEAVL